MEHSDGGHLDQARVGSPGSVAVPRRRDARRNRELLIGLAQDAFAEHGVDASLEQIARKAGLAIGTLYRHFPTRIDLLLAAFEPKLSEFMAVAEAALHMDDPWEGFCAFLEALCATQAGDRGFNDFISMRFPHSRATEAMHDRLCELATKVIERGQTVGVVRPDITDADIISLVWANSRIIDATRGAAPNAWRRNLHIMIDGFRAARHPLPEPPLTEAQLYQAMVNLTTVNLT
ncbi:TetR family transcriptional regulator [Acrocarpospora phusangensis]|uniref:TetR family transcriptional regulator n=1 Tax=Acrocarpospora phusangensis TaxID=1070424 RepID=A0A919QH61_9ACTN|nr:TetR/AcrR family transcriptional regulator [Acrocarpospora phusangensis]GIH28718.1 TetR family transcriptional regulator [Acrocarpospora phusangensis]